MNTAEIITKVTMTLFINSNINISISVDWVVKTPCLFYFRSKVSLCQRNTHDATNFLANVSENFCSISAQKTTKQIFVKTDLLTIWKHWVGLESARATLCKWATRSRQTCFSKTFANPQTSRNNKKLSKQVLVIIKHCLGNSQINSIPE